MELLAEQAQPARHPIDKGDPGSRPQLVCQGIGLPQIEHHLARLHRLEELPPGLLPQGGPLLGRPLCPWIVTLLLHVASLACSHVQGDLLCHI